MKTGSPHGRDSRRSGLFVSRDEWFALVERRLNALPGVTAIARITSRTRVTIAGVVVSVTYHPSARVQAYEADLFDGTGVVHIIWLGRGRVLGIEPGKRLLAEGLVRIDPKGERSMYNPSYRIVAHAGD